MNKIISIIMIIILVTHLVVNLNAPWVRCMLPSEKVTLIVNEEDNDRKFKKKK